MYIVPFIAVPSPLDPNAKDPCPSAIGLLWIVDKPLPIATPPLPFDVVGFVLKLEPITTD